MERHYYLRLLRMVSMSQIFFLAQEYHNENGINRNGNEYNIARMLFPSDCIRNTSDISARNTYFGRDVVKAAIGVF